MTEMRYTTILILVMICMFSVHTVNAQKVGSTSMQFLKVMPTPQATAMGDAYVAKGWGVDAVFWNPAGLSGVSGHEITLNHIQWIFDSRQSAVAYGVSLGNYGNVGLQFQYVDVGEIEETRVDHLGFSGDEYNPGLTGNTFSPKSYAAGISYSNKLIESFSTGITIKYVYESLWSSNTYVLENSDGSTESINTYASQILFDTGMRFDTGFRSLVLGASVQNFGPSITFVENDYPAPMTFRLGIVADLIGGMDPMLFHDANNRLTLAFDLIHPNDYDPQYHIGMEYSFLELVAIRAGRKINYDSEKWTFGGGLKMSLGTSRMNIDYSYGGLGQYLGKSHRLSISFAID